MLEDKLADSDLILFIIDLKSGIVHGDYQFSQYLMDNKMMNKTILIANKSDKDIYNENINDI